MVAILLCQKSHMSLYMAIFAVTHFAVYFYYSDKRNSNSRYRSLLIVKISRFFYLMLRLNSNENGMKEFLLSRLHSVSTLMCGLIRLPIILNRHYLSSNKMLCIEYINFVYSVGFSTNLP